MWTHHPKSPWGDIDICSHGCCRNHRYNDKNPHPPICIKCDYPNNANIHLKHCPVCNINSASGQTWHQDNVCLRCKWSTTN